MHASGLRRLSLLFIAGLSLARANTATLPTERKDDYARTLHYLFLERATLGGIDVLFLGDSITDFWRRPEGGREIWQREFTPLRAANFGISADRTQHLLWRLENGTVAGLSPKVVVLLIGTNNTGLERGTDIPRNTPGEATAGVTAVVASLREKLPQTKILLLAIFPRGQLPDDPQREQIREINAGLATLADDKHVFWLDLGPKLLEPDGTLSPEVMPDFLHPGPKGYRIWAEGMKASLRQLLMPPR